MTANDIATYLKYANLQMAAEAFLVGKESGPLQGTDLVKALVDGNNRTSTFPDALAQEFAAKYTVVAQCENTSTGFSGTLFRDNNTQELILSFRSTEFIDDAVRDNQATNSMEIQKFGWAFGQIDDMETWYQELSADGGPLSGDAQFTVTGYSLGGHLATAFNMLRQEQGQADRILATYTFNGAGVGQLLNPLSSQTPLTDLIQTFDRLRKNVDGHEIVFADSALNDAYQTLRTRLAGGVAPTAADFALVQSIGGMIGDPTFPASAETRLLLKAMQRVALLMSEAVRVSHLSNSAASPQDVPVASIDATSLDYQMAVLIAGSTTASLAGLTSAVDTVFLDRRTVPTTFSNFYDLFGANPPSVVSNSQLHYGTPIPIFIENQPLYRGSVVLDSLVQSAWYGDVKLLVDDFAHNDFGDTHSLVLIVDSLSLMSAFSQLDPNVSLADLHAILKATTNTKAQLGGQGKAEGDTLETALDALRRIFLGTDIPPTLSEEDRAKALLGNTWADPVLRDKFYANLTALTSGNDLFQSVQGQGTLVSLVSKSASEIRALAQSDIGYRYALSQLDPFAITGVPSLYAGLGAELSLYNPATGQGLLTGQYLADRAAFLGWKNVRNWLDTQGVVLSNQIAGAAVYVDRPGDPSKSTTIQVVSAIQERAGVMGVVLANAPTYVFGSNDPDSLAGGIGADHIYGSAGDDLLRGGKGSDYLEGGSGNDTYAYNSGDGRDVVLDTDHRGVILYEGNALQGGGELDAHTWISRDGKFVYTLAPNSVGSNTLTITGPNDGRIEVRNFHSGDLGITLDSALPTFTDVPGMRELRGDWGVKIWYFSTPFNSETDLPPAPPGYTWHPYGLNVPQGLAAFYQVDELGNKVRDSERPPYFGGPEEVLLGSPGADHMVVANTGSWSVLGKGGDDQIEGGLNPDRLYGGAGNDFIEGGMSAPAPGDEYPITVYLPEQETIYGGAYDDLLDGGSGNDTIFGETEADLEELLDPRTQSVGGPTKGDVILAGTGDDLAYGSTSDDAIFGGAGKDILVGGAGNDFLDGDDNFHFYHPVYGSGRYKIEPGSTPFEVRLYPVSIAFDSYPDPLDGPTYQYYRIGGDADILDGGAGNDTLFGMSGADVLIGGDGDDLLAGWEGDDVLEGGEGNDLMAGDFGRYEQPNQRLTGASTLKIGAGVQLDADSAPVDQQGNDFLDGGAGNDVMYGEAGDDIVLGGSGDDQMWGDAPWIPDSLAGTDEMHGGDGDDAEDGGAGDDQLYGEDGADDLRGSAGNDYLDGGDGADVLDGGQGNDVLLGGDGVDQLLGGAGDDYLEGGLGDDVLVGGDGADVLVGGAGFDALRGGAGDDTYVFNLGDGREVIDDNDGVNRIVLGAGIYASDVSASVVGSTLVVNVGIDGDALVLSLDQKVSGFELADGSTLSQASVISGGATSVIRLRGTQGQALTVGTSGADTLSAAESGEELYGGGGSDTYYFGKGSGNAVVLEEADRPGDVDRILITGDVHASDLVLQRVGTDLVLSIEGSPDTLTVRDQFSGSARIEEVQFDDGTVWNAATIESRVRNLVTGTSGDDRIEGTPGSDLLEGGDGGDTYVVDPAAPGTDLMRDLGGIDQEAYDAWYYASIGVENAEESRLFGGNWVVFGHTADLLGRELQGSGRSLGTDPFRETSDSSSYAYASLEDLQADLADYGISYGANDVGYIEPLPEVPVVTNDYDGLQLLYDAGLLQADFVEFAGNITVDDLIVLRSADGMSLNLYAGDHEAVEVQLAQPGDPLGTGIEWFAFAYNTTYALEDLLLLADSTHAVAGTTGDDALHGGAQDEVILGLQGDDSLAGGAGSDVYLFGRGSGHDVLDQSGAGVDDVDTLRFTADVLLSDIGVSRSGAAIVLTIGDTGDSITLLGWFEEGTHRLAHIEFSDGTVLNGEDLAAYLPNQAPILAAPLPNQTTTAYIPFSVSAAGLFTDPDEGDSLTYQALLAGGGDLPAWLLFDPATQTLSGTPGAQDLGTWQVTITAVDGGGLSAATTFTLTVDAAQDSVSAGTPGDDSLVGTAGSDRLDGGPGRDTMSGGRGRDTYVVDDPGDQVIELQGGGFDIVESSVTYALPDYVEQLVLTGSADIDGTGNRRANTIIGNDGANVLDGGGGADTMIGGRGDDTYIVDKAADVVVECPGGGNDTVLSAVTTTLSANVEVLVLTGSRSIHGTGNALDNVLVGNDAANVLDGSSGADTLLGGKGNDAYIVDNPADVVVENPGEGKDLVKAGVSYALSDNVENLTLTGDTAIVGVGNAQDNVLTGNAAASLLVGGAGNDTYVVSDARTGIVELANEGIDLVKSSVSFTLAEGVENLTLTGTSGLDGFGNALDNVIRGNDAANLLDGFAGDDTLQGNLANDVLRGGQGNDVLRDNGGDNVLDGGSGDDNLVAKEGSDLLIGGTGNDVINTGAGADIIAFNRGDGQDRVAATDDEADNVLSLGGGIGAQDLSFKKSGSSLVLQLGGDDQITFSGWYAADADNRSVAVLQLVGPDGGVQAFDFLALVTAFDAARASNPKLKTWTPTGAMSQYSLGSAPGGLPADDLALWYAQNGSLDGLDLSCDQSAPDDAGVQTVIGDDGNDFLAGGAGGDVISTGAGANVIAFNKGGGSDAVFSDASASNTLSLGGTRYDDLSLAKSGDDLILETGADDRLVLKDWYAGNDDVRKLQVILDSTDQYDAASSDPLVNRKVETFDFLGLVAHFDESREQNPGLTSWAVTNALLEFHLAGADDAALGGDLAYRYAHDGSLQGISPQAAQQVIGAPGFGSEAQQLGTFSGLQEGLARIG